MARITHRLGAAALVAALLLYSPLGIAESTVTEAVEVPVDRVIANIERRLAQTPDDTALRLNLARTHMMAYVVKRDSLWVPKHDPTLGPTVGWGQDNVLPKATPAPDAVRKDAAAKYLAKAIAIYEDVIARAPTHALARLGYAWSLQEAGFRDRAIAAYRETIRVAFAQESSQSLMLGAQTITEEAAKYLIPLLDRERDKAEIDALKGYQAQVQKQKRWMTPIVIPLRDGATAIDLTDDSARVLFDLDGTGIPKRWTWITPDAGWLVMDLHRRGRITSALQMFGSVTFWLFWENGYDAMTTLDDNGDGFLRGAELDGLALWRDANQNGVSEAGEVAPLSAWHITELSCRYRFDAQHPDEIAFSPTGVRFDDGHTRPTFDLVMHSGAVRNSKF